MIDSGENIGKIVKSSDKSRFDEKYMQVRAVTVRNFSLLVAKAGSAVRRRKLVLHFVVITMGSAL